MYIQAYSLPHHRRKKPTTVGASGKRNKLVLTYQVRTYTIGKCWLMPLPKRAPVSGHDARFSSSLGHAVSLCPHSISAHATTPVSCVFPASTLVKQASVFHAWSKNSPIDVRSPDGLGHPVWRYTACSRVMSSFVSAKKRLLFWLLAHHEWKHAVLIQ
jgi:hypothetical protein